MRTALAAFCGRRLSVYATTGTRKGALTVLRQVRGEDHHLIAEHMWVELPEPVKPGRLIGFTGRVYQYIRSRTYEPDFSIKPTSKPIVWR